MSGNNSCNSTADDSISDCKPDGDNEININDNLADDSRKIFVGGLSWETSEDDLKQYFSEFGDVRSCIIKLDRYTNQSRGFGFVMFDTEESVNKVLDKKEHVLNKKKIDPKRAKPSREPQKKIFIGGLDPDMSESQIKEYFSQFGEIENIETPFDSRRNKRKAYLFITFSSENEARKAANQECQEINGKRFEVRIAVPRDQANRTKGWKSPNSSLFYPYTMLPYIYPDYLYSYMYSNPQLYNAFYNPYEFYNYDPVTLSRQLQTGLMIGNTTVNAVRPTKSGAQLPQNPNNSSSNNPSNNINLSKPYPPQHNNSANIIAANESLSHHPPPLPQIPNGNVIFMSQTTSDKSRQQSELCNATRSRPIVERELY